MDSGSLLMEAPGRGNLDCGRRWTPVDVVDSDRVLNPVRVGHEYVG